MGFKDIQPPLLPGQPGKHPCFNSREIRHQELISLPGNKSGTDQLGKDVRHVPIDGPYRLSLPFLYQFPRCIQRTDIVARQVLDLHQPARPAPRPVGPVELQQSPDPAVLAHAGIHSLIFLHRCLPQFPPDPQYFLDQFVAGLICQYLRNCLFLQVFQFQVRVFPDPLLQLCHAVRVFKSGDLLCPPR